MNKLFLLDIDNTLLVPQNIFIYYHKDGVHKKYSPDEYAKIDVTVDEKKYYDYSDFRNPEIIKKSIETSSPLHDNLNLVRDYILDGWQFGILTARGEQDIIRDVIYNWLEKNLNMKIPFLKNHVYGVNDKRYNYPGYSDATKKLYVVKKIVESKSFDKLCVIDDNKFTIDIIKNYNEEIDEKYKVKTIYVEYNR